MILNLEEPTEGRILLEGEPIQGLQGEALRAYRAKVQAVFQDPWSSLNPRMKVGRTIAESLIVNAWGDQAKIAERVRELLLQVGLRPEQAEQYPHEFSGGQRQRVALAAALASRPQADRARRAGLGARRVDPRPDDEPAEGHPGAGQRGLPAGGARSRHGAPHGRPHGGDVSRQDRREGADASRCSRTSAIPTPRRCSPPCWSPWPGQRGGGDRAARRGAVAAQSAVRLPLPYALPLRHAALFAAGAGSARGLARPSRRLSFVRQCSRRRCQMSASSWGPLQGVKVVACSTAQAGTVPYMLMADLGADVIKIEVPEGGDNSRRMTVLPGMPSTFFETNNRGVKSVTLNLKIAGGPRDPAQARRQGRHLRPELPARRGREERLRLRGAAQGQSQARLCLDLGLRPARGRTPICRAPIRWRRRWAASPRPIRRRASRCAPASSRWPTRPAPSWPSAARWRRCTHARTTGIGQKVELLAARRRRSG